MKPALTDWLAWLAARLAWPGLLGLALLLAAGAAQLWLTRPMHSEARDLAARAERLAARPAPPAPTAAQLEARRPLAERLPEADRDAEILAGLFAAAGRAGLSLDQGNYRLTVDRIAGLQRQQITLPVAGDYPAIRAFVAHALARHPSLALDGLQLARDGIGAGQVRATLRFTLYLREGA